MNNKYYITFGTASHFPYGIKEYVVAYGKNEFEASEAFRSVHPNRIPNCYNYSFIYNQSDWENSISKFYEGIEPSEIIGNEKEDIPMIYVVEKHSKADEEYVVEELGYATDVQKAREMISILSNEEKDEDTRFSICPTFLNQVLVNDKVIDLNGKDNLILGTEAEMDSIEDIER